jgi:hypothetical protein
MIKTHNKQISFKSSRKRMLYFAASSFLVLQLIIFVFVIMPAHAASLTNTYLRLNRLSSAQTTTGRLVFKTATAGAPGLVLDMDGADSTKWSTSSGLIHAGTIVTAIATCATETGPTGLPGTLTVTGATNHTITITGATALAATTSYCVDFTTADSFTDATANTYHPTITETGGATDSTTIAVATVAAGGDQFTVTGSVPPTFTFALQAGASDNFTTALSTGAVSATTGKSITLTTNAANGWIVWVKDANGSSGDATKGAIKSATASNFTIPTTNANALGSAAHTISAGSQDYGLGAHITNDGTGGGTVSLDAAYNDGSGKIGVLDVTNFRPIASANGITGTGNDVVTITEKAAIDGMVPAANDYTDTIYVIGAGNF